jgi:hypothetical protein
MALEASQESGRHVAAVSTPFRQLLVPETVKPDVVHVG